MKKTLSILLALMMTVLMLTSSVAVFADEVTEEAVETTEEAAEVVEGEAVEGEAADDAAAEEAVEEETVPMQVLDVVVNKDGSSQTSLVMPVPSGYESQVDGIVQQYEAMGVTTEVIDDYQGFKAIKVTKVNEVGTPCNVSTPGSETEAFAAWVIDGMFKTTTIMNANYDFAGGYYAEGEEIAVVNVTLPSKAKIHNAESVNGATYTWTLRGGINNPIRFVMESYTITGIIAIAVVALIIVLVILCIVISSKKKKEAAEDDAEVIEDGEIFDIVEEADAIEEVVEDVTEEAEEVAEATEEVVEETPETEDENQ